MDPVSFAFSALSTAGICIKLFNELKTKCHAFRNAVQEVRELVLSIEHQANRAKSQMEVLRSIWDSMDPELQITQNLLLEMLQNKLRLAVAHVDGLIGEPDAEASWKSLHGKHGETRRAKYAASSKSKLKGIVEDIESWQRKFDPTWFLIIRMSGAVLEKSSAESGKRPGDLTRVEDTIAGLKMGRGTAAGEQAASRSIFMAEEELNSPMSTIRYSGVKHSILASGGAEMVVDARTTFARPSLRSIHEDVRLLARKLQEVDPMTFGLLRCYGVLRGLDNAGSPAFHFVFEVPRGLSNPRSLRMLLLEPYGQRPLDERVRLGRLMARSVAFVHNVRFVHKNVSPETILLFDNGDSVLGTPFLVGFENFRRADGATVRAGDLAWETNLYRHPDRQGVEPEEDYIMQHDIYSLGVCLLEVGLWESFISWPAGSATAQLSTEVEGLRGLTIRDMRRDRDRTKEVFVEMAKKLLPCRVGTKYTDVVVTCLTCLDDDNAFGDESDFRDNDGILVGVRYIEKVLMQLEDIAL